MINKTKDYENFIFREDNREKIDQVHVRKLVESIKSRNMLDLRPIIVNNDMEVIDGQHRLLAAKELDVEIYYQVEEKLSAKEIVLMNIAKSWTMGDYLNFYCQNNYLEYKKLKEFILINKLTLKVALQITIGHVNANYKSFKNGNYIFSDEIISTDLDICWETIAYIKKMNGFSPYTSSGRFWKALLKLVRHMHFNKDKWRYNLQRMVERICVKATVNDYSKLLMDIYNYRNQERVNLLDEET